MRSAFRALLSFFRDLPLMLRATENAVRDAIPENDSDVRKRFNKLEVARANAKHTITGSIEGGAGLKDLSADTQRNAQANALAKAGETLASPCQTSHTLSDLDSLTNLGRAS